ADTDSGLKVVAVLLEDSLITFEVELCQKLAASCSHVTGEVSGALLVGQRDWRRQRLGLDDVALFVDVLRLTLLHGVYLRWRWSWAGCCDLGGGGAPGAGSGMMCLGIDVSHGDYSSCRVAG